MLGSFTFQSNMIFLAGLLLNLAALHTLALRLRVRAD